MNRRCEYLIRYLNIYYTLKTNIVLAKVVDDAEGLTLFIPLDYHFIVLF